MSNVAVIGSQWGDEGKGKIVDWLSDQADIIIRFHQMSPEENLIRSKIIIRFDTHERGNPPLIDL